MKNTLCLYLISMLFLATGCTPEQKTSEQSEEAVQQFTDDQQMITLASIIYDPTTAEIEAELANTYLATTGKWKLVWGPGDVATTRVFVAQDTTVATGKYAVVIRGTIDSLESWFYDFDALEQVPLPWVINGEKMIGKGLADAWNNINLMPSDGMNMLEFFNSAPVGSEIFVTGHSQGGGLATIVAAWLYDVMPNMVIKPVTFAGQTAGNSKFATAYNQRFKSGTDSALDKRYYNTLDIVPRGYASIMSIKDLYSAPGPSCPDDIRALLDLVEGELILHEDRYTQVGTPMPLNFYVIPDNQSGNQGFMAEVGVQHSHYTYQYLLKAPYTSNVPSPYPPTSVN